MIPAQMWAVEVEHRVKATPETVFAYFTDPEKYRRWQGVEAEIDPRPGGTYRVMMVPQVWARGEYLAVEPPHRLLMRWGWESTFELPRVLRTVPPGSSTVEFTFTADGEYTIIRVRHLGLPTDDARWAHELGWSSYLPRLGAVVDGGDPGEDPSLTLAETYYSAEAGVPLRFDRG